MLGLKVLPDLGTNNRDPKSNCNQNKSRGCHYIFAEVIHHFCNY